MVTRRRQSGFTAAEIVVVVAIIGILAAFAIPAMSKLLATQAVRSASYDLYADLTFARSEAIARGTSVSITGASGTDFTQGWTITDVASPTPPLRTQSSRSSPISFTASSNVFTFDKTGRVSVGAPASFDIRATTTNVQDYQKRCVRLDPSGRPRTAEGACS